MVMNGGGDDIGVGSGTFRKAAHNKNAGENGGQYAINARW